MAVKSSRDLAQKLKTCNVRVCQSCGLYLNQLPIFDRQVKSNVFWVGLSAVQFNDDEEKLPLSPLTRSGALIDEIENPLRDEIIFYKTNLVKCVPLKDEKIRYPLEHEMEKCFPNFDYELGKMQPSVVFLLGKQVASFVMKRLGINSVELPDNFDYSTFEISDITFVPIHHPSYMLVYKRKSINKYKQSIQDICCNTLAVI